MEKKPKSLKKMRAKRAEIVYNLPEGTALNLTSKAEVSGRIERSIDGKLAVEGFESELEIPVIGRVKFRFEKVEPNASFIGKKTMVEAYTRSEDSLQNSVVKIRLAPDMDLEKRWKAIVGIDETKDDILWYSKFLLKEKDWLSGIRYDLDIKGKFLLHGPPGTGKTFVASGLADALSREMNKRVVLATIDLSAAISEFVGQTGKSIYKIFESTRMYSREFPVVLFIDELDALARTRADPLENPELKRAINIFLMELDAISFADNVIVMAATNFESLLDPAIWRRFDKTIEVGMPNQEAREVILSTCLKRICRTSPPHQLAEKTEGYSGADLKKLVRESFFRAMRNGEEITRDVLMDTLKNINPTKNVS